MPYPDGRETRAERHYAKCRGPMGFHCLVGTSPSIPHKVTRELARALWKRGYDVSCEVESTTHGGWSRTSIRHLEGMVKQPFASLSWGCGAGTRWRDFPGQARIEIATQDSLAWADERELRYINDRVDLLIVPGQSSYEAYLSAGVTCPIEIVPWGVDTTVYQPWPKDEELLSKVVFPGRPRLGETLFLAEGSARSEKGLRECIEAFRSAVEGGLEASLILVNVSSVVITLAGSEDLPIGVMPGDLDEWSMARLYSSVDFFVSPEGLEREVMACGTCSVTPDDIGPMGRMTKIGDTPPELVRAMTAEWSWDSAAAKLACAVGLHLSLPRRRRTAHAEVYYERTNECVLEAGALGGDIGFLALGMQECEIEIPGMVMQYGVQLRSLPPMTSGERQQVTVYGVPPDEPSWVEPLASLGIPGFPLVGMRLPEDLTWFAWSGGYYPRGLGLIDVVLWAKANGVPVTRGECECTITGDPPWWDGASGQAEAEERLGSHLEQLDYWWADLLHHIRKTGWW